jgi:hypothetical protein
MVSSTAWDEDEDIDFGESSPPAITKKVSAAPAPSSDGWGEDDLEFGDVGATSSKLSIGRSQAVTKVMNTTRPGPSSVARDRTTSASKKGMSLAKPKKAAVQKISTTDDDDWDF